MKINRSCRQSLSFPEQSGVWLPSLRNGLGRETHTGASGVFFLGSTVGTSRLEVGDEHPGFQRERS